MAQNFDFPSSSQQSRSSGLPNPLGMLEALSASLSGSTARFDEKLRDLTKPLDGEPDGPPPQMTLAAPPPAPFKLGLPKKSATATKGKNKRLPKASSTSIQQESLSASPRMPPMYNPGMPPIYSAGVSIPATQTSAAQYGLDLSKPSASAHPRALSAASNSAGYAPMMAESSSADSHQGNPGASSKRSFEVDTGLISSVPKRHQAEELQQLGLTVFNQEEFEQAPSPKYRKKSRKAEQKS